MQQAPGTNGAAATNSDARQNGNVASDPGIVLDYDLSSQRPAFSLLSLSRVDRVSCAHQLDAGRENDIVPDGHAARICNSAVRTNDHVVADGHVVAIIAVERCLYHDPAADRSVGNKGRIGRRIVGTQGRYRGIHGGPQSKDLPEEPHAVFGRDARRGVRGVVESPDRQCALLPVRDERWSIGQVILPAQHLVAFRHFSAGMG